MQGECALTQDTNHVKVPGAHGLNATASHTQQAVLAVGMHQCGAGLGQADRAEPRTQKQPYTGRNTCPRTDRGNHRWPFSKCRWTHIRPESIRKCECEWSQQSLRQSPQTGNHRNAPQKWNQLFLLWRIHTMRQCTLVKITGDSYMRQGQINLTDIMVSKKGCQIEGDFIGRASYQIPEKVLRTD